MESLTYFKDLSISPKKMRMIRAEIFSLGPQKSMEKLLYLNSKPAVIFYKAIKSALHNGMQTLKVEADMLEFKSLIVEEGRTLKRYTAGSRGSAKPISRRRSHLKIVMVAKKPKKLPKKIKKPKVEKSKKETVKKIEKKTVKEKTKSKVTKNK